MRARTTTVAALRTDLVEKQVRRENQAVSDASIRGEGVYPSLITTTWEDDLMRPKMLVTRLVAVVLWGVALPAAATSGADGEKAPAKTPAEYLKIEIRGKLTVPGKLPRNPYDDTFVADAVVMSEGTPLALRVGGEALRKKLAALDGKTVVVTGAVRFAAPPADARASFGRGLVEVMITPPSWPYVEVSGIDAANEK